MLDSRRILLRYGLGFWVILALGRSVEGEAPELRQPPPRYRIIYNWDGAPQGYSEFPQSLDQFVQKTLAPVKDTQAGALFWCVGRQ